VLMIDSGMLPFLHKEWARQAFAAMNPGARVYIHDRSDYTLHRIVPSPFPPGWLSAAYVNETGYANCRLTIFARSRDTSLEIVAGAPLPDLSRLTDDPEDLEQIARLPFDYAALDDGKVIETFKFAAKPVRKGWFRKEMVVKVRLTETSGLHSFRLTEGRTPQGHQRLLIEKM